MHNPPSRRLLIAPRSLLAWALAAGLPLAALAQQAPTPSAAPSPMTAPAPTAPSDQTVQLSPFEVTSEQTKGYTALNSNSLTEFNMSLNKLPVSADVFDAQFMQDVGADNIEGMIDAYSAGAGINLSSPGGSAGNTQVNDRNGNTFISLRGLEAPTMQLDGLMPLNSFFNSGATGTGWTSSFNIERTDIIMGPQALLYGVGGAGGVINLVSKQAYFAQPATGSAMFRVDQYGHKMDELDYGMGTSRVAIRIALVNEDVGDRRVNVGGPMAGEYGQIAVQLPHNTVFRIEGTQTDYDRDLSDTGVSYTALNSSNDARNGQSLRYLLATNQLQASAYGASGGGYIGNGTINWNNVDSWAGNFDNESTRDTYELASLDTKWTDWLSTKVAAGYRAESNLEVGGGVTWLAPNATTNPFQGLQTLEDGGNNGLWEPLREKVIRGSIALTNNLFGGAAQSNTVIGADYTRSDGAVDTYGFVAADSNYQPVLTGGTTDNGYTFLGDMYFPAGAGPNAYLSPWGPGQKNITYSGQNYTWVLRNDTNASLVGPSNPLGLTGHGSGDHRIGREINKGVYFANSTTWLNGKLTTLEGVRLADALEVNQLETGFATSGDLVAGGSVTNQNHGIFSFNFGTNYALLPWLSPYVEVSDSDDPPAVLSGNPIGEAPNIARGLGEEGGFKIATANDAVSGSIAYFHASSEDEQYGFTSTLTNDINPSGLNGHYGAPSNFINVNRQTSGVQVTLTSSPTPNWRSRLSLAWTDATIATNATFPQFYNDQFYQNSAGDVTYADGDLVYVLPTYSSKTAVVLPTTAGAEPLTLAMMNNPSSPYYANPQPITSLIQTNSAVANVLRQTEPGTGSAIRTGVVGLPISALQIAPNAISPPPGQIVVAEAGDLATGYAPFSFNMTSLYTLSHGPLTGFSFGGTLAAYWEEHGYYFYPDGLTSASPPRIMFNFPQETTFNGIFSYDRKFGAFEFLSQINIDNMFNHYHVVFLPNAVTGYTNPTGAFGVTFDQQPRSYVWTNTIKF